MTVEGIDTREMKAYVLDKFVKEGDFGFLKEGELSAMVDSLLELDDAYMRTLGEEGVYDDDDAYEALFAGMKKLYPQYEMYCMRLSEDYLDFAEEYLVSVDAIEWE